MKIIPHVFFALLLSITLEIATNSSPVARATNMKAGEILSPRSIIELQRAMFLSYILRNESLYAANDVKTLFTVRDANTNAIVFQNETVSAYIAAYTVLYVQSSLAWIPQYAGRFRLSVELQYDQDVNPVDNTTSTEFRVELPVAGIFQAYRYNMVSPYFALFSQFGELFVKVPPRLKTQWLNVVGHVNDKDSVSENDSSFWIGKNLPLPAKSDSFSYSVHMDWSKLGVYKGIPKDQLSLSYSITDTTWRTPTSELIRQGVILEPKTFAIDDGAPVPNAPSPPIRPGGAATPPRTPILRETILRDSMPNIDLDSNKYNSGNTPGFGGDWNACGPAAIANSLQWLEREEAGLPETVTHRKKLELLSAFSLRQPEKGIMDTDMVRSKLHIIDSLKLPIRVKWQSFYTPVAMTTMPSPITRYGHAAQNQSGGGPTPKVTMDWIVNEFKDDEDVELSYCWQDSITGVILGSHGVNVSGVITDGEQIKGVWVVDDADQHGTGGTGQRYLELDESADPRGPVVRTPMLGQTTWIYAAYSESYDTTIKFESQQGSVGQVEPLPKLRLRIDDGKLIVENLPSQQGSISILDASGRAVLKQAVSNTDSGVTIELRGSGVPHGAYLVILHDGERTIAQGKVVY